MSGEENITQKELASISERMLGEPMFWQTDHEQLSRRENLSGQYQGSSLKFQKIKEQLDLVEELEEFGFVMRKSLGDLYDAQVASAVDGWTELNTERYAEISEEVQEFAEELFKFYARHAEALQVYMMRAFGLRDNNGHG